MRITQQGTTGAPERRLLPIVMALRAPMPRRARPGLLKIDLPHALSTSRRLDVHADALALRLARHAVMTGRVLSDAWLKDISRQKDSQE
ncbi:MAG: hypothetical protein M3329_02660 [Pseudomonadota bacterium]|nr:hypothetical protein [Pseudomonadota bacterium]